MAFFSQAAYSSLYIGPKTDGDVGYVAFIPARGVSGPSGGIELDTALTDQSLGGSFLFSPVPLDLGGDAATQQVFVGKLWDTLAGLPASRGILWIADPQAVLDATGRLTLPFLGLSPQGNSVASGLSAPITQTLRLAIDSGMSVSLVGQSLVLDGAALQVGISFTGASAPNAIKPLAGSLPFSGVSRGGVGFSPFIQRLSLLQSWNWGFQFLYPQSSSPEGMISEWLPLAYGNGTTGVDMIGFDASIDPADPVNTVNANKSILLFTAINQDGKPTTLASFYRTVTGDAVTLWPVGSSKATGGLQAAGLVFTLGQRLSVDQEAFQVTPQGDFVLDAPVGADGVTAALIGGLQGTEFLSFVPGQTTDAGARLRFSSNQGAYTPQFPPPTSSPVGPPTDPNAPLLNTTYTTSWATLLPPTGGGSVVYVAQPKGSALFGQDPIIAPSYGSLFGSMDPGNTLPAAGTSPFPIVPYAGATAGDGTLSLSASQMESFETLVVGPTRRAIIGKAGSTMTASAKAAVRGELPKGDSSFNTTTPSGVIATVACQGGNCRWSRILLGQTVTPAATTMAFNEPTTELQQAFQTNQLFLVVANSQNLVDSQAGSFANSLNIENWLLQANVGASEGYDDYTNVMIVKGIKGPLYDPQGNPDDNLVANPSKWTQRDTFAAPTFAGSTDAPDTSQLTILSKWLQDYFVAALAQAGNVYFQKFNAIAKDPNWTGILTLRARIADVPTDLAGIMAGISDPTRFYAHHFAIEISQVKNDATTGIGIDQQSSVFGLIYYVDPSYDESKPTQPVAPTAGQTYDYRVLTLKVLFQNTAISNFSSYTQLTLNKLFAASVDHMGAGGNGYNSIILNGTYQNNQGKPIYNMSSSEDWTFYFNSPVLNKVEITSAQMITVDPGSATTDAVIWFGMTGFIDFLELQKPGADGAPGTPFDLFSFGNSLGQDYLRQGLSFSNLGLRMSYPTATPANRTMVFDTSQMRFDMQTSTPRTYSLYKLFALTFEGLISGDVAKTPTDMGYLDLITDLRLAGVADSPWYGIKYRLDMGTPGQLAGDVGLTSTLLTSWAPGGGDAGGTGSLPATINLALPGTGGGAKLISLQTVLSLSIGMLRLTYDTTKNSFLLMMTEIALKFLGILKLPPSGSTSFFLFGNPNAGGKPSGLGWYAMYNNEPKTQPKAITTAATPPSIASEE